MRTFMRLQNNSLVTDIVSSSSENKMSQRTTKPIIRRATSGECSACTSYMARIFIYPSLDSREAVEDTCDQRRHSSDCADAQADLWSHVS